MREFIKSVNSYSWAMSLFGVKQMANMLSASDRGESPATQAMDDITGATRKQLGSTLDSIYRTGDAVQRWTTDVTLFMMFPVLMMMSESGGSDRSSNREASNREDESARNTADEEIRATPIRNTREAAGGRKR